MKLPCRIVIRNGMTGRNFGTVPYAIVTYFYNGKKNLRVHHSQSVIVFPTFFNVTIDVNAFKGVAKFMERTASEMFNFVINYKLM